MSMHLRTKIIVWVVGLGMLVLVLSIFLWKRHFHDYTPAAALLDLRAGYAARHAPQPVEQFLELRYGPQTDPANRRAAFIDFFNAGHIEGLSLMAGKRTNQRVRDRVTEIAKVFHDYRGIMSLDEKKALADYFNSEAGRAQVKAATDLYQSKDVHYRAVAAPVIQELMTTLAAVKNR